MKTLLGHAKIISVIIFLLALCLTAGMGVFTGCDEIAVEQSGEGSGDDAAENGEDGEDDDNDGDEAELPSLVDDDKTSVSPCPNQALLTDATFVQDLKVAEAVTISYNGTNFPTGVCATGSNFDPTEANLTWFITAFGSYDINVFLDIGVGVCGDDSSTNSLPVSGVYRRDFKFTANARSYRIRMRATVTAGSPDVLGDTLASVEINNLETDIDYYDSDGVALPEDSNILSTLADELPSETYTVKKASDSSILFTALVEMICAEQI